MGFPIGEARPLSLDRMGSYVDWDDPTLLPFGLLRLGQNIRFIEKSLAVRYGLQRQLSAGVANKTVNGLACLNYKGSPDKNTVLAFLSNGTLWREGAEGSGALNSVATSLLQMPSASYAQMSQGFNRMSMAFTDLVSGSARPAVIDNSGNLDPISCPQMGQAWEVSRYYNIGNIISPTAANSHLYRATTAGTSAAAEPSPWPTSDGGTVVDGGITWKEFTPNAGTVMPPPTGLFSLTRVAALGTFAAARDVYVIMTVNNGNGESLVSAAQSIVNTVLNDRVAVTLPAAFFQWLTGLAAPYAPTTVNVYEADVATGATAPATSAYKKVAGGPFGIPGTVNIDAAAAGAAPPSTNTATISPAGNWCTGTRNLVVLQENRNGYQSGMKAAAVITFNIPASGRQLWVGNIYVGPGNCAKRICAFTMSGDPTAGPFRYIGQDDNDPVNLGVSITKTVVADNATTGAYFNVTDSYFPTGGVEVTDFFNKIEIPPCIDVYFAKSLARNIYTGATTVGPSSYLISEGTDPETVKGNTGELNVSNNDRSRAVCWREMGGVQYALKQNSGSVVNENANDPRTWAAREQWSGSGPCGPRAVDVIDLDETRLMIYVHRTGAYLFTGSLPQLVSKEMDKVFKRVNWAVQQLIWVAIDHDQREVHIGLPLDGSTSVNKELVLNYSEGWGPPYQFVLRKGGYVPIPGRKWALNDLNATIGLRITRTLSAPPAIAAGTITSSQMIFGSSSVTGSGDVYMQVPNYYSDLLDGVTKTAIDAKAKFAYGPLKGAAIYELVGAELNAKGIGKAGISCTGTQYRSGTGGQPPLGQYDFPDLQFTDATAPPAFEMDYAEGIMEAENYGFGFEITNRNTKDWMFELHHFTIFVQPRWNSRI